MDWRRPRRVLMTRAVTSSAEGFWADDLCGVGRLVLTARAQYGCELLCELRDSKARCLERISWLLVFRLVCLLVLQRVLERFASAPKAVLDDECSIRKRTAERC
jgi:hypothetical protein